MAARDEVVGFLNLFKGCLMLGQLDVKGREKNRQGLVDLDLSPGERWEVLQGLEPDDYVAGPMPDDTDDTKEVWMFGKNVEDTEVYIKLRVTEDPRRKNAYRALVWSFHPAEHPLKYPLRGGEK